LGIAGVALAVNIMLVLGIGILMHMARTYVDFSVASLFAVPGLALALGLLAGRAMFEIPGIEGNDWLSGLLKAGAYSITFTAVMLVMERSQMMDMFRILSRTFLRPQRDRLGTPPGAHDLGSGTRDC
jgi:hypothetical protein